LRVWGVGCTGPVCLLGERRSETGRQPDCRGQARSGLASARECGAGPGADAVRETVSHGRETVLSLARQLLPKVPPLLTWVVGFGVRVLGLGFGVWGLGVGVWGLGFRV